MKRYIPDSLTLIMITSNIKDAFDPMMEEASDMEEEDLHTYLDNLLTEFTNRLKGDKQIALIQENNEAADAAEGEDENG